MVKIPSPLALPSGGGPVTYTFRVTNPGVVALSNVRVTDDRVSPVNFVSGDVNADNLLQPGETWIFTATTTLSVTTMNTATARGSANDMTATDIAYANVVVTAPAPIVPPVPVEPAPAPVPIIATITGGQLPDTATPWYNVLLAGTVLLLIAAAAWKLKMRYQ